MSQQLINTGAAEGDKSPGVDTRREAFNKCKDNFAELYAQATTTQLTDLADAINTTGKFQGKQVYNTTTNAPVWASGSTAASVWNDATGTLAHTPA